MPEREADLRTLRAAVERLRHGEGGVALVEAPAGMGKTTLLRRFAARLRDDGVAVLTARGASLESTLSFGVVQQLFERRLAAADAPERERLLSGAAALCAPAVMAPGGVASAPVDAPFAVAHGLFWLVANLAQDGPLVLVVDDAHWADEPSLRALCHIATRLGDVGALIVVGMRTGEAGDAGGAPLAELAAAAGTVVRPGPLSVDAVAAIVADAGGRGRRDLAEAVHGVTRGNPFLVRELVRALGDDGGDLRTLDAGRVGRLGPPAVARSLLLRLGRLPGPAVPVARAVAVLAGRAEVHQVAALAGVPVDDVRVAVDALVAAQVLAPSRPLDFVHPIVRTAVYDEIAPGARAAMHARAAAVLRDAGLPPMALAPHLLASEPAGDAWVVSRLRAAADAAVAQGAPGLAARYLARALREPPAPGDLAAVLGELGTAEWLEGVDMAAAVEHLAGALERTPAPADRPGPVLALHRALFAAGRLGDALDLLDRELPALREAADPEDVMRVEAEAGAIGLLHPSTVGAADRRLRRFEDLPGDTPAQLLQLANIACHRWATGTAAETVAFAERALVQARVQAADAADSIPIYEALWALVHTDRLDLASAVLDQTLADARARGSVFGVTTSGALRAVIALRRGDVAAAELEARSAVLPGLSAFVRPPLFGALAHALVERGDLAAAEEALAESGCGPDLPEFVCLNPVFHVRGRLRLAQGRTEEALADFMELGRRSERLRLMNPWDPWRLGAARALVRLGRTGEALALTEAQLELARRWGTTAAVGAALHGRAMARGGDVIALEEAVRVLATSSDRLAYMHALVDLGAALRVANLRVDARAPLREALDLAHRGGASVLEARAREELAVAGARPRRRVMRGVEALTAAERRVAELAAEGHTNREIAELLFVTVKTVENQLGRVYAKLGIASRAGLGDALAAGGAGSPGASGAAAGRSGLETGARGA